AAHKWAANMRIGVRLSVSLLTFTAFLWGQFSAKQEVPSAAVGQLTTQPAKSSAGTGDRKWPRGGQLFVGACYQPIDRSPDEIVRDIAIMKRAGFNVVRMGDLSWDSFEPVEGKFEFEWFDR